MGGVGGGDAELNLADIQSKVKMSLSPSADFQKTFHVGSGMGMGTGASSASIGKEYSPTMREQKVATTDALRGMDNTLGSFGADGSLAPPSAITGNHSVFYYGNTRKLPSPSARNLEMIKHREFERSLKIYARAATTTLRYLGEGGRDGVKSAYSGSKRNVVNIHRGVRLVGK